MSASPDGVKSHQHSQTAQRTLDVLRLLAASKEGLTLAAVARAVQAPKGSLYPILATMQSSGFVDREQRSGQYFLSPKVLELSKTYLAQMDTVDAFNAVSPSFVDRIDETMQMAVRSGTDIIYVARRDSTQPVRLVSTVGQRLPAHATALGKCLLSECSEEELVALYPASELQRFTDRTIGFREALIAAVAEVRDAGAAEDWEEITAGLCCAAAPIRDASGRVVAAVSFSMPVARADTANWHNLRAAIREAAAEISQRIGFRS
ncbi:IclR family transcriptional regulator [Pedococcus sp. 5OH_020]|uniref:IclR family transcriptional regulator n=1 Tax=Pedococcus sp. 5OH_020 TaxID=2989814 RepID=UPI0022E9A720|nr:IclR family transcriptional regulator [Pedococcus sp. 5OH_020]